MFYLTESLNLRLGYLKAKTTMPTAKMAIKSDTIIATTNIATKNFTQIGESTCRS